MSEYTATPKAFTNGLPDSVKIGPIEFRIVQEPCPTATDPEGNSIPVFGKISFKEAVITIDAELEAATKWQCYFHEVIHALLETIGMAGAEENEVDALAYAVMGFMLDNGYLTKFNFPAPESKKRKGSVVVPYPHTKEKKSDEAKK
jgi:hypothetical protein